MITYHRVKGDALAVRLCGRLVGRIARQPDGWRYVTIGRKHSGNTFKTLDKCKASIEGDR